MSKAQDVAEIRQAMSELDRIGSWPSDKPPLPEQILTPPEHRNALDLDRTLVVGNRGVGKTFWSQALVDQNARQHVAGLYPQLGLSNVEAYIGFSGGYASGFTPSERTISEAEQSGVDSARLWEGVLLRFLAPRIGLDVGTDLKSAVNWLRNNVEAGEKALRKADEQIGKTGRFLLVFDALDALGDSWTTIRRRLDGLIRFARLARSFRSLRLKIFLRLDQAEDRTLWESPDASKLYNERVRLSWNQQALYDLLFFHLKQTDKIKASLERLAPEVRLIGEPNAAPTLDAWYGFEEQQRKAFSALAGHSMGGGTNRGNTYNWVVNHLADAHGETTPRAFLVALAYAAKHALGSKGNTVIDHLGIQAGVREASERRFNELQEDYWWINIAFEPLADASVPCDPADFIERWKDAGTARKISDRARRDKRLPPIAFEIPNTSKEKALLMSLSLIGVVENRSNGKINVPDIFRVAASIKRKGGVKPPPKAAKRRS